MARHTDAPLSWLGHHCGLGCLGLGDAESQLCGKRSRSIWHSRAKVKERGPKPPAVALDDEVGRGASFKFLHLGQQFTGRF